MVDSDSVKDLNAQMNSLQQRVTPLQPRAAEKKAVQPIKAQVVAVDKREVDAVVDGICDVMMKPSDEDSTKA